MAICLITGGAAAQLPDQLQEVLERVAQRVQEYYERAQSIICLETVRMYPIQHDLMPVGPGRSLEYDLRLSWDAASEDGDRPEPMALRELRKVNGRPPRADAEPGCTDPRSETMELLSMMLPNHREEYAFRMGGSAKVKDRPAFIIEYKSVVKAQPPEASWKEDCISYSIPEDRLKGRVWVDRETYDVLRLDLSLKSSFEIAVPRERRGLERASLVFERYDMSTRYRRVVFHDPEETILLPESIETTSVGNGVQGIRKTQQFTDYRRFLTSGRIVK